MKKPRIGRPPKPAADRRVDILRIRLTKKERRMLNAAAGENVSAWARAVLLRAAKQRKENDD